MQCPRCRHENPAGVKFCGECGARLESRCPSCAGSNPAGNKFCHQCGAALSADRGSRITPSGESCERRRCAISGRPGSRRLGGRRSWTRGPGSALAILETLPESRAALELGFDIRLELRPVLNMLGEVPRPLLREAAALAERLDDDHRRGQVYSSMSHIHVQLGKFTVASRHEAEVIQLAESTHHAYTVGLAHWGASTRYLLEGDWVKARFLIEHWIATVRKRRARTSTRRSRCTARWACGSGWSRRMRRSRPRRDRPSKAR